MMKTRSSYRLALFVLLALTVGACDNATPSGEISQEGPGIFEPTGVETSSERSTSAKSFSVRATPAPGFEGRTQSAPFQTSGNVTVTELAFAQIEGMETAGVTNVNVAENSDTGERRVVATLTTQGSEYSGGSFYVTVNGDSFGEGNGLVSNCFEFGGSTYDDYDNAFFLTGAFNLTALQEGGECAGADVSASDLEGPSALIRVTEGGSIEAITSNELQVGVQVEQKEGRIFASFGSGSEAGLANEYDVESLNTTFTREMSSAVLGQDAYFVQGGPLRVAFMDAEGEVTDYISGLNDASNISFETGLGDALNPLERADIDHYLKAGTDYYSVSGHEAGGRIYDAEGNQLYETPGGYIVSSDMSENWVAFAGGDGIIYLLEFNEDGSFGTRYTAQSDEISYISSVRFAGNDRLVIGANDGVYLLGLQRDESSN